MIRWRDEGVLLSVRRHGETSAIVEVFTSDHGRVAGVVRGGASRKMAPVLQPGTQLDVTWSARLDEHLGSFTVEPIRSRAAQTMGSALALAGLNGLTALLVFALPEREPNTAFYDATLPLFDLLGQNDLWPLAYARWEALLLEQIGQGLDLSECAVLGPNATDLTYVSPRTGRAVSQSGAGEWADKLLPLSQVLLGQGGDSDDIRQSLVTTGHFLTRFAQEANRNLPMARARLLDAL